MNSILKALLAVIAKNPELFEQLIEVLIKSLIADLQAQAAADKAKQQ